MAISIESISSLQEYLGGVLNRADHHAKNVEGVALALLGAIIWRADGEITVREYAGRPANIIWFFVSGNKYVMSYNHEDEQIELKERSSRTGNIIATFDNSTSYQEIIDLFRSL